MPKIAFLMDPIETVSVKKDSTLAMIAAAQQRGLEIFYLQQDGLVLSAGVVTALTRALRLREDFCTTLDPKTAGDDWYALGDEQAVALAEMDIVMMRKDPPFDMEYIYTTYLLERAEAEGVMVVNRPSALRDCNEKLFATLFPQCCPELIVSRRMDQLKAFHKQHANVVFKNSTAWAARRFFALWNKTQTSASSWKH